MDSERPPSDSQKDSRTGEAMQNFWSFIPREIPLFERPFSFLKNLSLNLYLFILNQGSLSIRRLSQWIFDKNSYKQSFNFAAE